MKPSGIFLLILGLLSVSQESVAIQEHWTKGFRNQREYESPEAFVKIYISRDQLIALPDGTFLKTSCGHLERVRAILEDTEGLYVLIIQTQCPLCGVCYLGKEPPADMSCPIYEIETRPYVWSVPR